MIGILGASAYEGILDSLNERTVVTTRYGEVSVLLGEVNGRAAAYVRRFGWEDNIASDMANHAAHALAFKAHHLARLEVCDDHDLASDQVLGGVRAFDARDDLARFVADLDLYLHELPALLDWLGLDDARDPQLHLHEVGELDLVGLF